MDVKIRKAKKGDLKEIARIYREGYMVYNEKWTFDKAVKKIRSYSKDKKDKIFVAVVDNNIVGFIIFHEYEWINKNGFIDELFVDKKFRGGGIGGELVRHIVDYFKKRKIKEVELLANTKSKAMKFYKKMGFKKSDWVWMERKVK